MQLGEDLAIRQTDLDRMLIAVRLGLLAEALDTRSPELRETALQAIALDFERARFLAPKRRLRWTWWR